MGGHVARPLGDPCGLGANKDFRDTFCGGVTARRATFANPPMRLALASSIIIAGGIMACASGGTPAATSDTGAEPRWTGTMQPTQSRSGEVVVTAQNRASGSMVITGPQGSGVMQRSHVVLSLSLPQLAANQVRWAVLPNRCGSADLPVIGFELFPLLEVGSNGRAELQTDLPLELTPSGSYHVNVYLAGQQLENVFVCGNLRYDVRK